MARRELAQVLRLAQSSTPLRGRLELPRCMESSTLGAEKCKRTGRRL
jgi:hypothetical protein